MKKIIAFLVLTVLLIGTIGVNAFAEVGKAESLVLSAEKVTLKVGEAYQFTGTLISKDGYKRDVTKELALSTESGKVIKMEPGVVKALESGQAIMKASYKTYKASMAITVVKKEEKKLTSIKTEESLSVVKGQSVQLKTVAFYNDGSTEDITKLAIYTYDSIKIKIEESKVYGLDAGNARIKVSYKDKAVYINVVVKEAPAKPVEKVLVGIKASEENIKLVLGETKKINITAVYNDNSTADITGFVQWSSNNRETVRVEAGKLYAAGKGTANITAAYKDMKAVIKAEVSIAATSEKTLVGLKSNEQITVKKGQVFQSYLTAYYSNGTSEDVTKLAVWTTDCSLFKVEAGKVIGVTPGNGVLKMTYMSKSIYCNVKVLNSEERKLTGIRVSSKDMSIRVDENRSFTVTAIYSDNTTEEITNRCSLSWEKKELFKVENGVVTGLNAGTGLLKITYKDFQAGVNIIVYK